MVTGIVAGFSSRRSRAIHHATAIPARPAMDESITLSISICRIRRERPAPRAERIAISRTRAVARASKKLAALAQAIISTRTKTPSRRPVKAAT